MLVTFYHSTVSLGDVSRAGGSSAVWGSGAWPAELAAANHCSAALQCFGGVHMGYAVAAVVSCTGCEQILAEQAANGLAGSFYNTSADVSVYGLPFAFYPRNFLHQPAGWPVIFINGLSAAACAELLQYLTVANFLDSRSATLTLEVVTYNADLSVFG